MITHLMVGTNDKTKAEQFYDAALGALGIAQMAPGSGRLMYGKPGAPILIVTTPSNGEPATHANGGTIGIAASDTAAVDSFHSAGLANGGTDEGAPGHRPNAPGKAYGAYLRDPDGNKLCAFAQMKD